MDLPLSDTQQVASGTATIDNCLVRAEGILACFRAECAAADPLGIADLRRFLDGLPPCEQADVLIDLVAEHLNRAWERGRGSRLEQYVAEYGSQFSELSCAAAVPADLIDTEFLARYTFPDGDAPGLEEYQSRFPGRTDVIDLLESHHRDGGRYVLVKPKGQGGQGRVWLAYDRHLNRYVAIKEPKSGLAEEDTILRRLAQEARVTARLEHPAIVSVHEYRSSEEDTPFYVMRLVHGPTLQEVIADYYDKRSANPRDEQPLLWDRLIRAFTTVCDAIAYAHARGVLHRDLKPGNIVLGDFGETVVLDWGLAKVLGRKDEVPRGENLPLPATLSDAQTPTEPGHMVGTPEFASPEQAAGQVDLLGPTTDVYGLGAVLYCLLTGRSPFSRTKEERQGEMLGKVKIGDFPAPRQVKPGVQRPLEAVCLKAMARRPEDRYASVELLGNDVKHWLADAPVSAWPEPLAVKVGRWVRKNRVLAASVAVAAVVALVLGTAVAVFWQQQRVWAWQKAEEGLVQVAKLRDEYRFDDAEAMMDQVGGWASQAADRQLRQRLARAKADLELARDLDEVRQKAAATTVEGKWGEARMRADYPSVLAGHGLDVLEGDLAGLAEKIRASAVRASIVATLDDWARAETDLPRKHRLLELANLADEPAPWRQGVRQALLRHDGKRMLQLLRDTKREELTPGVVLLAWAEGKNNEEATVLLRQMQREQPRNFWVNFNLGIYLRQEKKYQEAAECYLVAVVLRPDSFVAYNNLGLALADKGKVEEAIACFRQALAIEPKHALPHNNLGNALQAKGQLEDAIACYRRAIALDPKLRMAHNNLGVALHRKGKVEEAIACYRQALALDPKDALAHCGLGHALHAKGKVEEAITCWKMAIDLDPKHTKAHYNLGLALHAKGKLEEAIACYQKALALDSSLAPAHNFLGAILAEQGKVEEAIIYFRKAIALDTKYGKAHHSLGVALVRKGQVEAAIACVRQAIALEPKDAAAHNTLGNVLHAKGKVEEAIACWRKAIELDPKYAPAHNNLGNALKARGNVQEAITCFHKAISLDPKLANPHGALGQTLMQLGRFSEAQQSIRRCLALLPPNHSLRAVTSQRLQQCHQWIEADAMLKAYLTTNTTPTDATTQIQMADLAQQPFRRLYLTAVRLYRDAFARQPWLAGAHRYNAACAAALASTGLGKDTTSLDNTDRAELRYSALSWLQDDLAALARHLGSLRAGSAEQVHKTLLHWQKDADLAAVRDSAALRKLPEAEQVAWRNLWAQVDALLVRPGPGK